MTAKADYVRSQGQTRSHHCHWPGCDKQVPPAMWGCKAHWFTLPKSLRDDIWRAYRPGQEVTMTPSRDYLEVSNRVQQWIRVQGQPDVAPSQVSRLIDNRTGDLFTGPENTT